MKEKPQIELPKIRNAEVLSFEHEYTQAVLKVWHTLSVLDELAAANAVTRPDRLAIPTVHFLDEDTYYEIDPHRMDSPYGKYVPASGEIHINETEYLQLDPSMQVAVLFEELIHYLSTRFEEVRTQTGALTTSLVTGFGITPVPRALKKSMEKAAKKDRSNEPQVLHGGEFYTATIAIKSDKKELRVHEDMATDMTERNTSYVANSLATLLTANDFDFVRLEEIGPEVIEEHRKLCGFRS